MFIVMYLHWTIMYMIIIIKQIFYKLIYILLHILYIDYFLMVFKVFAHKLRKTNFYTINLGYIKVPLIKLIQPIKNSIFYNWSQS